MKPIIKSVKHIAQTSLTLVPEQTILNIQIAEVVEDEPGVTPNAIVVGSAVKALYLEYWLIGEGSQPTTATWSIEKVQNKALPMTHGFSQSMHIYPNKRNVFKIGQGVIGDSNTNPIPIIREWVKIPKGKQRMAQGDSLFFNVSCVGQANNGVEVCGTSLYKEYQ